MTAAPRLISPAPSRRLSRLAAAPAKELVPVSSTEAKSQPCEALAPHGYLGIETQVVGIMADWILAHPPAEKN